MNAVCFLYTFYLLFFCTLFTFCTLLPFILDDLHFCSSKETGMSKEIKALVPFVSRLFSLYPSALLPIC